MTRVDKSVLITRQAYPLDLKIELTKALINKFYKRMKGKVYVAFSGGKDSTVLLHIVRSLYPDVSVVFVNTGLQYPEIRDFVKTVPNVTWIRPEMSFYEVIQKYGYPVISKTQSLYIRQYRHVCNNIKCGIKSKGKYGNEHLRNVRWYGKQPGEFYPHPPDDPWWGDKKYKHGRFKISEKWKPLVDAPFKISEQCCDVLKKKPFKKYGKKTGEKPILATMASDSLVRERVYLKAGCNIYEKNKEKSMPMSFWLEKDVWEYIKKFKLDYAKIYDKGVARTGCIFCMFGIHLEKTNRFEILKELHPELYDYCMNKLGIKEVLEYIDSRCS